MEIADYSKIRHDVKRNLSTFENCIDFLTENLGNKELCLDMLEEMKKQAKSTNDLVKELVEQVDQLLKGSEV